MYICYANNNKYTTQLRLNAFQSLAFQSLAFQSLAFQSLAFHSVAFGSTFGKGGIKLS